MSSVFFLSPKETSSSKTYTVAGLQLGIQPTNKSNNNRKNTSDLEGISHWLCFCTPIQVDDGSHYKEVSDSL